MHDIAEKELIKKRDSLSKEILEEKDIKNYKIIFFQIRELNKIIENYQYEKEKSHPWF